MKEVIEHTGIVESIDAGHAVVKIVQTSSCSACKAREFCASNENKEKFIDVYGIRRPLAVGDDVVVCASASMGWQAIGLAFVVPLVIMMTVLGVTLWQTGSEPLSAIIGIASLLPYYLIIYMNKERLTKKMAFWIKD